MSKREYLDTRPRILESKYRSRCHKCRDWFQIAEKIVWLPGPKLEEDGTLIKQKGQAYHYACYYSETGWEGVPPGMGLTAEVQAALREENAQLRDERDNLLIEVGKLRAALVELQKK